MAILTAEPDPLHTALKRALPSTIQTVYVALSGGLDSTALLHASLALRPKYSLTALHIHHGLSPQADNWQAHCTQLCANWKLPLVCTHVQVEKTGQGPEADARAARYAAFAKQLGKGDVLLLAQHQDDQVETMLLRLLRGAGPKGLAAMSETRSLGEGILLRPWLDQSKQEITAYAKTHHLSWVEDDSNQNLRFDRNFLRHEIIPKLRSRWPALGRTISRSAHLCAEATHVSAQPELLPVSMLNGTFAQAASTVHQWLAAHASTVPSKVQLEKIVSDVAFASADATPELNWPGGQVRRFQQHLYYLKKPASLSPIAMQYLWNGETNWQLPNPALTLSIRLQTGKGVAYTTGQSVSVRFYQGGERIRPAGSSQSKALKKLFQEQHIPPWQRRTIPLIFIDDTLVQVVGLCSTTQVTPEETGLWVSLKP